MRQYHYIGLGNAIVDRLYNVPPSVLTEYNLKPGDFKRADLDLSPFGTPVVLPGGSISNICYSLGLLNNTKGQYLGTLGDDELGMLARESLQSVRIDTTPPATGQTTFTINVLITPDGQRTFVPHNRVLTIPDHIIDFIPQGSWLLLEGYILFEQPDLFVQAIQKAKAAGTKIVLFLAAPSVAQAFSRMIGSALLEGIDMLICNETEMHALMQGVKSHEDAKAISGALHFTPRVITHGAGGATYMDENSYIYAPIPSGQVTVVDTTGAGDAFAAGFLDGYMRGEDISQSLKIGHIMARKVIGQIGGRLPLSSPLQENNEF